MSAKKRLSQYIDYKGLSDYQFCKTNGFSAGYLNSSGSINSEKLATIISNHSDLNILWLVTGDGSMLKDGYSETQATSVPDAVQEDAQTYLTGTTKRGNQSNKVSVDATEDTSGMSLIKHKICKYLDYKGISHSKFYTETHFTQGSLSRDGGVSEENLLRFLKFAFDVNLTWLLTGEGNMLKGAKLDNIESKASGLNVEETAELQNQVSRLEGKVELLQEQAQERDTLLYQRTMDLGECRAKLEELERERLDLLLKLKQYEDISGHLANAV